MGGGHTAQGLAALVLVTVALALVGAADGTGRHQTSSIVPDACRDSSGVFDDQHRAVSLAPESCAPGRARTLSGGGSPARHL
jgi:hypothetical protein